MYDNRQANNRLRIMPCVAFCLCFSVLFLANCLPGVLHAPKCKKTPKVAINNYWSMTMAFAIGKQ